MFNLNSCIEVFGVQVEPQPSVLFAAVNKAVEPLCQFTFFDLRYNDISCLVPFWCRLWDWLSRASWDRQLGVNLVQVLCGIPLGTFPLRWGIRDTDWSRTICLFHELFLARCIGAGCGQVFVNSRLEYEKLQVSGSLETYDRWAVNFCDTEGYSSAFPFVGTSYGNGTAMRDLWAAVDSEGNIWV